MKHSDVSGTRSSYEQAFLAGLASRTGEGREGGTPSADVAPGHGVHTERCTLYKEEPKESKIPRIGSLKGGHNSMVWNKRKINDE